MKPGELNSEQEEKDNENGLSNMNLQNIKADKDKRDLQEGDTPNINKIFEIPFLVNL